MIRRIEALNFKCLRHVDQTLGEFQVLVGPNASGKTTFLDVVAFLGDFVSDGLESAIHKRTSNFVDLVTRGEGTRFELAIELSIPEQERRVLQGDQSFESVRYEIALGINEETGENHIFSENVLLISDQEETIGQTELFPRSNRAPKSILQFKKHTTTHRGGILTRSSNGKVEVFPDQQPPGGVISQDFKLGATRSALANLPEDVTMYPVATWLKYFLTEGVRQFVLDSQLMQKPSPPGQVMKLKPDGSNLPWIISHLKSKDAAGFEAWLQHLRTAFQDLMDIDTVLRAEDRHKYLVLRYEDGLVVPSWMASDGTLRMLALTLPAYLKNFDGVYLIEEPENGIHPRAVETMFQSLSSVYGAQMLVATHSPVILSLVKPEKVLCFAQSEGGETDIVTGDEHPKLRGWQGQESLGVLFAAGVLG